MSAGGSERGIGQLPAHLFPWLVLNALLGFTAAHAHLFSVCFSFFLPGARIAFVLWEEAQCLAALEHQVQHLPPRCTAWCFEAFKALPSTLRVHAAPLRAGLFQQAVLAWGPPGFDFTTGLF